MVVVTVVVAFTVGLGSGPLVAVEAVELRRW